MCLGICQSVSAPGGLNSLLNHLESLFGSSDCQCDRQYHLTGCLDLRWHVQLICLFGGVDSLPSLVGKGDSDIFEKICDFWLWNFDDF